MGTEDNNHPSHAPQMGQAEKSALASRLRARGNSVLLRDQPEQARDLRAGADLIEELIRLRAELRRAADETRDESTESHLRELLGGGV
jgi:hypothetical protein